MEKNNVRLKQSIFILIPMAIVLTMFSNWKSIVPEQGTHNLKDAYKDAFLIGTAVTPPITSGRDKASHDIVVEHFNTITVENVMKAAHINPEPGKFNFGPTDDFVAFGEKHDMFIVANTLVWHNQCPPWFFTNAQGKPNTKAEQIERLRSHIETVAGRYAGRVGAWDVVHDGMNWMNDYPIPGRTNYPLLWDRQRKPKQALEAVLSVTSY